MDLFANYYLVKVRKTLSNRHVASLANIYVRGGLGHSAVSLCSHYLLFMEVLRILFNPFALFLSSFRILLKPVDILLHKIKRNKKVIALAVFIHFRKRALGCLFKDRLVSGGGVNYGALFNKVWTSCSLGEYHELYLIR